MCLHGAGVARIPMCTGPAAACLHGSHFRTGGLPRRTLVGSCASSSSSWLMMASALKSFTCRSAAAATAAQRHWCIAAQPGGKQVREHQAGRAGLRARRRRACGDAPRRQRTQCVAAAAGQTDRPPCPASCSAQGDRTASGERGWRAGPWAASGAAPPRGPTRPSARHKPRGHDWLLGGEDEAAAAAAVGGAGHCRCRLPPGHRGRPAQGLGRAAPAAAHAARLHGRAGCSARHPSSRCLLLAGLGGCGDRLGDGGSEGRAHASPMAAPHLASSLASSSALHVGCLPSPPELLPRSSLFTLSDPGPAPALSAPQLSLPTSSVACRPPAPAPPRLRSCTAAPRGGRGAATRTGRLGRRRQPAAAAACPPVWRAAPA